MYYINSLGQCWKPQPKPQKTAKKSINQIKNQNQNGDDWKPKLKPKLKRLKTKTIENHDQNQINILDFGSGFIQLHSTMKMNN